MNNTEAPRSFRLWALLAGMSGNIIEWYDFALYGVLAATLGRLFFPDAKGVDGLLSVYGVFAAGYLAKIIGGMVFGHIGDRMGRKPALVASAALMSVATLGLGCLPLYASAGLLSTTLFILIRLLQALSTGGELTSSLSYLMESAPPNRSGLFGSFAATSAGVGILLGALSGNLLFWIFSQQEIMDWAWRIPFLLSLPIGGVISLLRRAIPSEVPCQELETKNNRLPLGVIISDYPKQILCGALLGWGAHAGFAMISVYLSSYFIEAGILGESTALQLQTFGITILLFVNIFAGHISDKIGRSKLIITSAVSAMLVAVPVFILFEGKSLTGLLIGVLVLSCAIGLGTVPYQVYLAEQFPKHLRISGLGVAYNFSGILGGLTPLLTTFLIHATANKLAPAWVSIGASAVSLVMAWNMKNNPFRSGCAG